MMYMREINVCCILFLVYMNMICLAQFIYTNTWAVHLSNGTDNIERLARKYGFIFLGKVFEDGNFYHLKRRAVARQSLQAHYLYNLRLNKDPMVLWFSQQSGRIRRRRQHSFTTNDPLFPLQWHLSSKFDHNVMTAWDRGYTGQGVVICVLDDGLEIGHPDLQENYDPMASYDMNDDDPNPEPRYTYVGPNENGHGTRCAGQIAASANNSICGIGVAYHAEIGAIRMLDGQVTDLTEARSLTFNPQHVDVYVASWGPVDNGQLVDGPSALTQEALIRGTSKGRQGLGSVYVWAAGNGGNSMDNCNCDGYANSMYTLAVGSATERGTVPPYSEPCSAILTTTYSGGDKHDRKIMTTDLHGTCTTSHTGTSASAPLAAGIIALALQANPTLSWRDVQHITVRASRPAGLRTSDWLTNGAGRPVSHFYGYGLLDAGKLVDLAQRWRPVQPRRMCQHDVISTALELSGSLTLRWNETACQRSRSWVRSLEHVQVRLTLAFPLRGDLSISLRSPMATRSILLSVRPSDWSSSGFSGWSFMSTHFWDEDPAGLWTLQIENKGSLSNRGVLSDVQVELYGTAERTTGRHLAGAVVQHCILTDPSGGCKVCAYPLYAFGQLCVASCPTHFYTPDGNSSAASRRCIRCHPTCQSCYAGTEDSCFSCPPYATLQQTGTCSNPFYPWQHGARLKEWRERLVTLLFLGTLLLLAVALWAVMWGVSKVKTGAKATSRVRSAGAIRESIELQQVTQV